MSFNDGLNRVRFTAPVPVGSRIRGRFTIEDLKEVAHGEQARVAVTIELEGKEEPACVAEVRFVFLRRPVWGVGEGGTGYRGFEDPQRARARRLATRNPSKPSRGNSARASHFSLQE